jgi:hypothetical protein
MFKVKGSKVLGSPFWVQMLIKAGFTLQPRTLNAERGTVRVQRLRKNRIRLITLNGEL